MAAVTQNLPVLKPFEFTRTNIGEATDIIISNTGYTGAGVMNSIAKTNSWFTCGNTY